MDALVKLWDAGTGECVVTFVGHVDEIVCVEREGDVVVSGSEDQCIRVS